MKDLAFLNHAMTAPHLSSPSAFLDWCQHPPSLESPPRRWAGPFRLTLRKGVPLSATDEYLQGAAMSHGRLATDGVRERGKVRAFTRMRGRNSWSERFSLIDLSVLGSPSSSSVPQLFFPSGCGERVRQGKGLLH